MVSALVPYKRLDIAVRACAQMKMPLTIVGQGPERGRLRQLAETLAADVTFVGWLEDAQIRELYRRCRAVLMPGVEDFGMVPVEAQACGRPVVALAEGGALESVVDGVTGVLVRDSSVEAFANALQEVASRDFDRAAIRRHAEAFSKTRFLQEFQTLVVSTIASQAGDHHISVDSSNDPADGTTAGRYAQGPHSLADRESENRSPNDDDRHISVDPPNDQTGGTTAARYAQNPHSLADREDKK